MALNQDTTPGYSGTPQAGRGSTNAFDFGNPVYNQIGGIVQSATGRAPTFADVSQWGTNVDPNYMAKISSAIYNTPEAQAYAKSQQQPAQPSGPSTPPPATGSPTSATGQITPAPPTPVPAPSALPQPAQNGQTPNQTRYVQPVNLSGVSNYQAYQFQQPTAPTYNPSALPAAYAGGTLSQFTAPDQSGTNGQQNALISAILANPSTLSPDVVNQMKGQQQQQALLAQQATQQQIDQSAAARGVVGSGQTAALTQQNQLQTLAQLLGAYNNIDVTAAQTNRQDALNALGAAGQVATTQMGNAATGYNTALAGQTAQQQVNQAAAQSALQTAIAGNQNQQAAADIALQGGALRLQGQQAQATENNVAYQNAVNKLLAQFGVNTGVAQNAQQNYNADVATSQIPFAQQMQIAQMLENARQFNDTLGYNYNSLDQTGQMGLLQYLLSTSPGGTQ